MQFQDQDSQSIQNRREFLKLSGAALGLGAIGAAGCAKDRHAVAVVSEPEGFIRANDVILFQGDSITDAGRSRKDADLVNNQSALGKGYAWLAASQLLVDHHGEGLQIYNRGISGNKVFQLADRWQKDCLDLKPNVLSILIGVNDIWHGLNGNFDGTAEDYKRDYEALILRTKEALPEVRLVICEPFVLRCGVINDRWFPTFDFYRAAARAIADAHGAVFVPFQSMFDDAVNYAPPEHWAKDGVHPSPNGASLMAHTWLKRVLGH